MKKNNRLVINSFYLIGKLFLNIIASFYISRTLLIELGVEGFGIYNVVWGTVFTLIFVSSTMSSAISRFFNFYLDDFSHRKTVNQIFTFSVISLIIISIIIFFIGCISSNFLIYDFLSIPTLKKDAAQFVFYTSLLVLCLNLFNVTFISLMMSNEDMKHFSIIGVFEIILKVILVTMLPYFPLQSLEFYGLFSLITTFCISLCYYFYCRFRYDFIRFDFNFKRSLFIELSSFIGWNIFGSISIIAREQGVNILLNLFFGPYINAVRGISTQVNNAIGSLASQLSVVTTPRITKSVSSNNLNDAYRLVYQTSNFCTALVIFVSFVIYMYLSEILSFWLGTVPDHTHSFIVIMLINLIIDSLSYPLITLLLALGNIRNYQLIVGFLTFLNLPISYICLSYGFEPESTLFISIFISLITLSARLFILKAKVNFSIFHFFKKVILKNSILIIMLLFFLALMNIVEVNIFISLTLMFFYFCLCLFFVVFDSELRILFFDLIKQ